MPSSVTVESKKTNISSIGHAEQNLHHTKRTANLRRSGESKMLILLIILILVFGFGGYRMGPGLGYYGGGGLSLILTIVLILLLLKVI
jgi:hypothetical protein